MEDAKLGALLRLFGKDLLVALPLFQLATVLIQSGCQWAQVQVASRLVYMWYRLEVLMRVRLGCLSLHERTSLCGGRRADGIAAGCRGAEEGCCTCTQD